MKPYRKQDKRTLLEYLKVISGCNTTAVQTRKALKFHLKFAYYVTWI